MKEYNFINWKRLLKNSIPKPIIVETYSRSRMHRRTMSTMAMGNSSVAIKAGRIENSYAEESLLLWIDYSPSMNIDFDELINDILKVLKKNDMSGIEELYISLFNFDYFIYRVNLKNRRQYTVQELKNKKDIGNKSFIPKFEKEKIPIKELFLQEKMIGFISDDVFERMKFINKTKKFNQIIFSDTDLFCGDNIKFFQENSMKFFNKNHQFIIIFDNIFVTQTFMNSFGKEWIYKYFSFVNK